MADYTIEKDREYGFLTASPSALPLRSASAELQIPAADIIDALEAVAGALGGRRVLDIGCRDGGFLAACRERGMVCSGWEDVPAWAKTVSAKEFPVATGGLDAFLSKTDGERFDVISLLNVLPFVKNPAKVLNDVRQNLLADKGIVIAGVPNTFSPLQKAASAELGLSERWMLAGAALNYFTAETLRDLLEGCSYAVGDMFADLPRELFMLAEPGGGKPLETSAARKQRFADTVRKHGLGSTLRDMSFAFGRAGLGDNIVAIARADAFSTACASRVITDLGK